MNTRLRFAFAFALALPLQAGPARLMPFLCRDAVVRESQARVALLSADAAPVTAGWRG